MKYNHLKTSLSFPRRQYCLGKTKPKQGFRSTWDAFKKVSQNFYLTEFSTITACLPACLAAWLPGCLAACLACSACLPAYLLACPALPACSACLPTYLQTSVTQQWLRVWIQFFYCLMPLQPERCLLAYCSMYNAFFMDLPVSSFVFHNSLLTMKSVDLVILPISCLLRNSVLRLHIAYSINSSKYLCNRIFQSTVAHDGFLCIIAHIFIEATLITEVLLFDLYCCV